MLEQRFSQQVLMKVNKLEEIINNLALEQARLLERFIWSDKERRAYDNTNLFLRSSEGGHKPSDYNIENKILALNQKVELMHKQQRSAHQQMHDMMESIASERNSTQESVIRLQTRSPMSKGYQSVLANKLRSFDSSVRNVSASVQVSPTHSKKQLSPLAQCEPQMNSHNS